MLADGACRSGTGVAQCDLCRAFDRWHVSPVDPEGGAAYRRSRPRKCGTGCALAGTLHPNTRRHPLPAVDAATAIYKYKRTSAAMRDIAIASAEWSFTTQSLDVGRKLLGRMPYNGLASNTERKTEAAAQLFLSSQPQGITGCYWTATSGRPRRAKGTSSIDQSCRAMTRSRSLERRGALALACVAVLPVVALAMVFLS